MEVKDKNISFENSEEREKRRDYLEKKYSKVNIKNHNVPDSIDIRKLEGCIFNSENKFTLNKKALEVVSDKMKTKMLIKNSFARSRAYFYIFCRRGELLLRILANIMDGYREYVQKAQTNYKEVQKIFDFWESVLKDEDNSKNNPSKDNDDLNLNRRKSKTHIEDKGNTNVRDRSIGSNTLAGLLKNMDLENLSNNLTANLNEDDDSHLSDIEKKLKKFKERNESYKKKVVDFLNFIRKKRFMIEDNYTTWEADFKYHFNNLIGWDSYKKLLEKIKNTFNEFSSKFSNFMRNSDEIYPQKFIEEDSQNLLTIEYRFCLLIKIFRNSLDSEFFKKILRFDETAKEQFSGHNQFIKIALSELNKNGKLLFSDWQEDGIEIDDDFFNHAEKINFERFLDPSYKSLIQKFLEIPKKYFLKNKDILDFFQFYPFYYNKISNLILTCIEVDAFLNENLMKKNRGIRVVLCLDVSFVLI